MSAIAQFNSNIRYTLKQNHCYIHTRFQRITVCTCWSWIYRNICDLHAAINISFVKTIFTNCKGKSKIYVNINKLKHIINNFNIFQLYSHWWYILKTIIGPEIIFILLAHNYKVCLVAIIKLLNHNIWKEAVRYWSTYKRIVQMEPISTSKKNPKIEKQK